MTNRTRSIVAGVTAMMAAGFTNSQLTSSQATTSSLLKAGIVGVVAFMVVGVILTVLPPEKAA